jgi:hypothetical protein
MRLEDIMKNSENERAKSDGVENPAQHHHDVPIVNVVEDKTIETEVEKAEGVLLEVDEADSLFGKRTGVKDSHGRY